MMLESGFIMPPEFRVKRPSLLLWCSEYRKLFMQLTTFRKSIPNRPFTPEQRQHLDQLVQKVNDKVLIPGSVDSSVERMNIVFADACSPSPSIFSLAL